jgi:hypothetical protein
VSTNAPPRTHQYVSTDRSTGCPGVDRHFMLKYQWWGRSTMWPILSIGTGHGALENDYLRGMSAPLPWDAAYSDYVWCVPWKRSRLNR